MIIIMLNNTPHNETNHKYLFLLCQCTRIGGDILGLQKLKDVTLRSNISIVLV